MTFDTNSVYVFDNRNVGQLLKIRILLHRLLQKCQKWCAERELRLRSLVWLSTHQLVFGCCHRFGRSPEQYLSDNRRQTKEKWVMTSVNTWVVNQFSYQIKKWWQMTKREEKSRGNDYLQWPGFEWTQVEKRRLYCLRVLFADFSSLCLQVKNGSSLRMV